MMTGLSYEIIGEKPIPFDFSSGYPDAWDIAFHRTDREIENEEYVPIYNFLYPLGERFTVPRDIRVKLAQTTVVQALDGYYLALTGCGMDCSWEICESYLNLGYYPMTHFCELPPMAGRGTSRADRRIIAGCQKSLEAMVGRYQRMQDGLSRL